MCGSRCATFDWEPTETNIVLPSGENARSRVECPPSGKAHDLRRRGDIEVMWVRA